MELLHKLYYDAETGFQSKEKLYKKAKEIDKKNNIRNGEKNFRRTSNITSH